MGFGPATAARRARRLAIGATAAVALAGTGTAAAAADPAAVAECLVNGTTESGRLAFSGLPVGTRVQYLIVTVGASGQTFVYNGSVVTDFAGSATTVETISGIADRPIEVAAALYLDRNGDNLRWDPDVDDTLYRGDGTVTACPASVTLTPK